MIYEVTNAYYFRLLNKIGGIESHLYYIARKYGQYDITVFFAEGDLLQVRRLSKYIRCIKLNTGDEIKCVNMFCCFNREVLDITEAENVYLVLHGDYLDMVRRGQIAEERLPIDERVDKYLGVSKHVCNTWEKLTGIHAEFIGEPVLLSEEEPPLLFLSATRLSQEKGWGRMVKLASELDRAGVKYTWYVYTDSQQKGLFSRNIIFKPIRLDITEIMPRFDAYIQLSDNEGFCLSVVEALMQGVPVIGTKLPVFEEIGLNKNNSVLLDLDMQKIPVAKIKNIRKLKFKYSPPADCWDDYLDHTPSNYFNGTHRVRALDGWKDIGLMDAELGYIPQPGDEWNIDSSRLAQIQTYEKGHDIELIEVCND